MERPRRTIQSLAGEQLNAVSFVMDYVEFHFNGPVLRCFSDPILESQARSWKFPAPGSRDAFCELIEAQVQAVEVEEENFIRLTFTDGRRLTVPLDQASRHGPEAATFQGELLNAPLDVW